MFENTKCRRCGCDLTRLKEPLSGRNETWKEFTRICKGCITPDEEKKVTESIEEAFQNICHGIFNEIDGINEMDELKRADDVQRANDMNEENRRPYYE